MKVFLAQLCPALCDPVDYTIRLLCPRQKYWSGLPFPSPGALTNPGIEPGCPALQADYLPSEPPGELKASQFQRQERERWVPGTGGGVKRSWCLPGTERQLGDEKFWTWVVVTADDVKVSTATEHEHG